MCVGGKRDAFRSVVLYTRARTPLDSGQRDKRNENEKSDNFRVICLLQFWRVPACRNRKPIYAVLLAKTFCLYKRCRISTGKNIQQVHDWNFAWELSFKLKFQRFDMNKSPLQKQLSWEKSDLNRFQYERMCKIVDFDPPCGWKKPNFCEVIRDFGRNTIVVSFEYVPQWVGRMEPQNYVYRPIKTIPAEILNCTDCSKDWFNTCNLLTTNFIVQSQHYILRVSFIGYGLCSKRYVNVQIFWCCLHF